MRTEKFDAVAGGDVKVADTHGDGARPTRISPIGSPRMTFSSSLRKSIIFFRTTAHP